jgi:hypothetical protein
MPLLDTKTLDDFISRYQIDAILWKANRLLSNLDNPILRNDRCIEVASILALIPDANQVMRDDYIKKIADEHDFKVKTIEKLVADAIGRRLKATEKKVVKKNKVKTLDVDPKTFQFFTEYAKVAKSGARSLDKIKIDKYKLVQLLSNFGYTRYEIPNVQDDSKDDFTFVRLKDNIISSVTRNQIIDYIEWFINNEYNFEGAHYEFVDSETLITCLYDQMRTVFSKDLFARVRSEEKIIINRDTKDTTYLYYQNGFVEITKDGWQLRPYDEMNGSVWEKQMLSRNFKKLSADTNDQYGYFADYVWKLANEDAERFKSLCSIIGYLTHDFYQCKLKAILFTDSSMSEHSEGRTGKTLLSQMIGQVRSYCEINGKQFDSTNISKYQDADMGTQVLHLNDVKHKGRFKFEFEDVFNDITEGYIVKKLYMPTFRHISKMIISTNKTLNIQGGSQRDRIVEFEVSAFFSEHRSPADHYGHWFIRDWNEEEFNRFDNFMCFCAQMYHTHGIIEPAAINLAERKLMNHTAPELIEFMDEIRDNLKATGVPWQGYETTGSSQSFSCEMHEFQFDRRKLYERFINEYSDFKNSSWFTNRKFNDWLERFSELRMGIKNPKVWKTNGSTRIQFIPDDQK